MSKKSKKNKKLKDLMSEMAKYLKDAGFLDASQKVSDAMNAMDGFNEDNAYDMVTSTPDVQMALPGSMDYTMTGEIAGGMQGTFSIQEATQGSFSIPESEKLILLANKLDILGLYEEADEVDNMFADDMDEIIEELEEMECKKKKQKVKPEDKDNEDKEGVGSLIDANGRVLTDVDQTAGFSGLSDAYMFQGYGNLEGAFGPTDR